jgi:hypothetical protein
MTTFDDAAPPSPDPPDRPVGSDRRPAAGLDMLIARHLDGCLTEDDAVALRATLHADPQARARFVEAVDIHAMLAGNMVLARLAQPGPAAGARAGVSSAATGPRSRRWLWAAAAGVAACLSAMLLFWPNSAERVEIVRAVGERYAADSVDPRATTRLVGSSIALDAGLLELAFYAADATVVVEAPARFRVVDALTLEMDSGRVTAHVRNPNAGLRVLTPHAAVLDRGTRFAVDVPDDGQLSEVHVFEGLVDTSTPRGDNPHSLAASEAVRITGGGETRRRDLRDATFVQPEEIVPLAAGLTADRDANRRAAAATLRQDAALLAWIDFNRGEPSLLVHGARTVQGRFPGEGAAEFIDADDHIGLECDAVARQLTLLAWVRLDRVPDGISSLYHTDGWDTPGQVHWMMLNSGQMRLAVQGVPLGADAAGERWPESREPLLGRLGRWMHLAAVYDADLRRVRFHTNGVVDSTVELPLGLPAVLGAAQIGNWNRKQHPDTRGRQLSGRIDELVILTRALSPEEIHAQYEAGKPYAE